MGIQKISWSRRANILVVFVAVMTASAPAQSEELRDLCADRPGLGTPSCTVDKGHLVLELGIANWTRDDQGPIRTDTVTGGDALLRYGVTETMEAQIGWTAFGRVRERDASSGMIDRTSGAGDLLVAVRQNLRSPDGSGFSAAIMPYATLPAGRTSIGAGDWGAGLIVPVSVEVGRGFSLAASPQIDAAVNSDGSGRHLGYGSVIGVQIALGADLSLTEEVSVYRDEDPSGAVTEARNGLSLAWTRGENSQWDLGGSYGLNRNSSDLELSFGYVVRF
jgi:hypothetical protein